MASTNAQEFRSSSAGLGPRELLGQPVSELLGVDDAAAQALSSIGVVTVFDLGSSWVFAQAASAVSATQGQLSNDVLDDGASGVAVENPGEEPLEKLRSLSA